MADDKYLQNRQLAYDLLKQEGYTDIGDSAEELFKDRGNSELAYNLLSKAGYTDIGKDYNEFANMLYGPEQKSKTQSRTSRFNEMARQRDEARNANRPTMSQSEVAAFEEKQAADMRARQQRMAERRAQAQKPAEEPVEQVAEPVAEEPVRSNEEMLAEIAGLHEQYDPIISEYERRLNEHKNTLDIGSKKNKENEDWLYAHRDEYRAAKQAVDEAQGRLNLATREEDMERLEAKRKENRSGMPTPQDVVAQRLTPFSRTEKYGDNPERQAAEELYGMAEQTLKQGSKYAPGYEGNALEKIWTAASQFAGGAANNFDKGSLTFGASEGAALKTAREVGEKNNRIVEDTIKSLGYDDKQVDAILSTRDEDVKNLNALTGELEKESGEIESMQRTYEDMVRRGDPKAASYGMEYKKKVDAYNKRIKGEYEPAYNKYLEDSKEYETIMSAVGTAVDDGLTDGEKAVLDALEEFTSAKIKRSGDVSVASAAGAGAEQSAEFMLDFILTGGMEKIGTKAAAKLASKRIVKNALGETGAKIAARGLADAGVSLARTAVMFPRNLSAYGEQLVQMTGGVDDMGRYQFDRTRENAALNTALTQYIEYWSEGFGEYFGAIEQRAFKYVTKAAPRTAIGKTLSQYRGSIGQYLDKGKFNGMFNEMLEEVVGSGMNALSGWMSNDRVGDKDAMKEFVAGEQLATLALSFLPMSVISARTNLKAYNKMKERYDEGVRFLNPFLKSGAIDRQELEDLVSTISEKTPEEIKDAVVSIADKARAANNGTLPDDFTTSLMGYLEGSFAMNLQNDVWENSAEKMDVVNAYTNTYYNANPAAAWDLSYAEDEAYDAAIEAGFSNDELTQDSYMLAQQAASLKESDPERSQILMDYATAKASASGLKDGYDEETKRMSREFEQLVMNEYDVNGNVVRATINLGGRPQQVFIVSKDASVATNGDITTSTGSDGLVSYRLPNGQQVNTAKAKDFYDAYATPTDFVIFDEQEALAQERDAAYEQALNTVSPLGQSRNLAQLKGQNVFVTGNGAYEPVRVERLTNNGQSVVISGDKEALKGIATAAGINSPGGTYLEIPVQSLYPMLATDEDGRLSTDMEMPEETASTQMPESAPQSPAGVEDLVGAETSIVMNGQPTDVFVTEVSDGRVFFDVEDAEGNARHFDMPVAEFERAMNGEGAPAAEHEPEPAPAPNEEPAPEAVPQNGTIPVNPDTGKKNYDDPSVTPEMAYEDLYGNVEEGSKAEENRDKWVTRKSEEADKAVKDAEKLVAGGEAKKKAIDNWDLKDNEDLEDLEARQNKAKAKVDEEIGATRAELPELRRRAAFWNELKEVADENVRRRERQAVQKRLIEQYGVDISKFDLDPRSMEELLARELSDFFRSGQRLNRKSVLDIVGKNLMPDLRKGGYAFVLSNDGVPVDKFVMDVDASYPGFIKDEQDAVNMVGDLIIGHTRGELADFIFNNRLEEAKKLMLEMENEEEQAQETETHAVPEQPAVPETPAEEPQTPAEETAEEAPEDLPEDMPEEIAEPAPAEEQPETGAQQPETGNQPEISAPKTEGNGEQKPEKPSESPEKPISSPEKGVRIPATAGEIRNVEEARAFFENQYGKGKRADNSVRVWELTHKQTTPVKNEDDGGLSNMAMSLATEGGLSEEEAAELITLGTQLAEDFIVEDGYVKFPQFFKNLVETFGDNIRPFSKSIYLGASANVPDEVADQMDDRKTVRAFDTSVDLNDISDVQDSNADIREGEGGVSEPVAGADGEGGQEEPVGDYGQPETGDTSNDSGEGRGEVGELDFGDDTGADSGTERGQSDATPKRRGRGGRSSNDGGSTGRGSKGNRPSGQRESGNSEGVGRDTGRVEETDEQKEAKAKAAEDAAYEAEKERIKDETDTNELKSQFESIKEKLTGLTDVFDTERAKLMGRLRALREKLQQLFSSKLNKSDALAREKVPYDPVSDSTGEHAIGSVVPSGSADYMRDALKRLEAEVGKPVAEYVQEELGYKSLDEMFTSDGKDIGLSAEQVDAVGLAIHQIKTGRVFIVGDMTGVGKGRVAAALIRWGKRNKKKVLFCTEQPNLFSAMNADLEDIGSSGLVPFIVNNSAEANITNSEGTVVVRHPAPNVYSTLFESGKDELPTVQSGPNKGKQYDFVMTTYSQLQASEEEEEGDSDKVKKKNERNKKGRQRLNWLKNYAKDAVLIMDESHTAAGEGSTRGENAKKLVEVAQGVTFLSATFAKTPESMSLYAIRSSMNDAMITRDQLIAAISKYGIPMQEILAASLFKTGEMVRRERDFDGVKTNWLAPDETYTKEEIETTRGLSDRTVEVINSIIDFQRRYVEPVIRKMNEPLKAANETALNSGAPDVYVREYDTTPYSGQVSNVVSMMLFALKAKKAAELAIEQIKRGEKPVIAVDNTLGAYVDQIEGNIESADFGAVLMKGLAFALRYQLNTNHMKLTTLPNGMQVYKKVEGDRQVEKFESIEHLLGENGANAIKELATQIEEYGRETLDMDLPLSPIDYIIKKIQDAGYKCGEITKRQNALVQNEDGTWSKKAIKHNKKDVINRFNGGTAKAPLPKAETYDAVVMNRSGATGNSMHASRRFGDQRPRKMIILQAAKDPNNEVQIRGRIDRTGQVVRGEYFYVISPIPAEKKITMMLKQKLASLDATSVGSEKVASNRVEAEDMDNKYGDDVARDFLVDHEEIHLQMDPAKQMKKNRRTGEYVGRPGLLYDLLLSMQRMTCAEQEMILNELEEAYAQKIEYLNQNGINDLATTTMNLDATTVDKAIMVKGKDNDALSEFAHDTSIERMEVNVLRKPMRSEDIAKKIKELGGLEKHTRTNSWGETEDVSYGDFIQQNAREAVDKLKDEKKAKQAEAEEKLAADIREEMPKEDSFTEEQYEEAVQNDPRLASLRLRNMNEYARYEMQLDEQLRFMRQATSFFKPGRAYLVPLNESEGAQNMYGRFLGYKAGKDGRPKSVEAVFATKDSRAMVSIPLINMHKIIDTIRTNSGGWTDIFGKSDSDYASEEARLAEYDKWWDKMIPANTSRSIRYMITGNILQAAGSLAAYRGTITTFTRKDAETGEVTVDKGLLLAEDFDPENFVVRTEVTKEDVWETPGEFSDPLTNIAVFREGDRLAVKFTRERGSRKKLSDHPVMSDDEFKALCVGNEIIPYGADELRAYVSEENAAEALDYLYKNYGFTQGHLLVMPDSTEKPDRIVYTNKPYRQVIDELQPKYRGVYGSSSAQREIDKALKTFKMDVTNEDLKEKIRELVQLRQAYIRRDYANLDDADLATQVIISEQKADKLGKAEPNESPEEAKARKENRNQYIYLADAFREELGTRGYEKEGHLKHYKQGKTALDTMIDAFEEFNTDEENAKIAKRVFDIMRKLNANYFFDEKASEDLGGQTRGDYVGYNWRYMNEAWVADQLKANTILHEMLHTATVYPFEAMQRAADHLVPNVIEEAKQADALFRAINQNKAFRHQIGEDSYESYTDYGVRKNAKEMLAETGANQKFRDDLAKVKVLVRVVNSFGQTAYQFTDVTDNPNATGGKVMTALEASMDILDRMLNAFDPEAYRKVWTGTGYGEMSYRENALEKWREGADTPEKRRIADAELAATERTLDSMGEALGVKINRVGRDGMPAGHKTAKGYFNPRTGEMTICMDNVTDERDAIATVLHETVGHKGLRELFGEQFNDAMVRIYAALDAKGRMWVNGYMRRHDLQPGDTDSIILGMEEYLSHLAESGDFKRSVWDDIKEILGKIVDLLFGTDGFTFTDRELNYILRASYEHLKNPNWLNTPLGKAQDTLWKRELGINETDPNRPTDPDGPGTGILYRDGETQDNALGNYEAGLARKGTAMITENQNADLPVKIGMEAVMKEVGMTELREDMDYLQRHNLASSRADTEAHDFELFRFTPMLEQVREVQSKLVGENATNEDREEAYDEIRDYLYAVSGLERNNYKNNEIEQAKKDAIANADSAFKTAVDAIENNDKLSDNDKSAEIAKLEKKLSEKKKEIEEKYEAMKKDWSGLTGLTGHVETEWREAEDDARKLIKDFKRKVGDNVALNELWNRIRACTDYSLEHAYKHGLLTRDEYEKLHGTATQPRMWNYYLPLRGFAQGTAEDVYSYSTFLNPSTNSVVTRKMKGRKTEADDPLATILNIAETEIVQGNDNWAKQALLKFVQSAGNNSLLTEKEPWYVKDTVTGKWSLGLPWDTDPSTGEPETLEHFEARMQDLREKGEAKKGRRGLKLENIMANKAHRNEHLIHVKVGGLDKMIWVNGNPALAKAVTGFGKKQSYQWIRRASRVLSNLFTTYSLDFSVKNLIRDTLYSRVALAVKEDREYRRKFSENWWKNGGVTAAPIIKLAAMWNSGELQRIPEDQRTERQQLFIDFMHDGGQTGYTIINSVNTIKRSLERSMRRAGKEIKEAEFPILGVRIPLFDDYAKLVSTLNEGFELLTRFTAYQTSRQSGRSGQRSASDAKEISVNFNRRGAQSNEGIWGHIAAFLGATHYFYNAGVQGFDNYLRLFKANTKKMTTLTAGFMVMGILTPLVNGLIASATGGGDDDWYWNIPEWVRRNNIIIGWKGTYIALPLPVEFRAPYGIGDITGAAFLWNKYANRKGGKVPFGDLALDLLSTASNILPVNPVEGYEGSRNIGDAVLRAVAPDATMFIVDLATNRDYTGRPLWKENPFSETTPKCFGAYASTPKGIVNACQKLSELTYNRIDIAPGAVRDFMNNYGGGFFRTAEDVSKILRPLFEDDPDRPFRWDNIPFLSGFTGHIDQDRSNSYAKDALNEYRQLSESVVAKVASQVGGKVSSSDVYDNPEAVLGMTDSAFRRARIQKILNSKDYELGKMYREGMNNEYEMKQYVRGEKAGQWYKSRTVKREGVDALKNKWLKLRDEWVKMPSETAEEKSAKALVQTDVENAWHVYYDAEANLADELMKKEYGK